MRVSGVGTHNTVDFFQFTFGPSDGILERVFKNARTTKVDNLEDTEVVEYEVVELKVAVGDAHVVEIVEAGQELTPAACDLLARHHARHDDGKEVVGGIFHDFVEDGALLDDIEGLNDIGVVQSGTNAEFGRHLFDVIFIGLVGQLLTETLDGKGLAISRAAYQTDGTSRAFANVATYTHIQS